MSVNSPQNANTVTGKKTLPLALAAIGVVYGDIGTSPLYTLREVFAGSHSLPLTPGNLLGILSLVFWALFIVITLKYVSFMMRADNRGEGGIMALIALTLRAVKRHQRLRWVLMSLGLFGAALFFGDVVITPAISVLSAVEGLKVAAPALGSYVVPITLVVLVVLFMVQVRGTASMGALFGPIMCLWFLVLAILGLISILAEPSVLRAVSPLYAVRFFLDHHWYGVLALGAVVLAVTGGEALYADMGHFGRRPIRLAWLWFVWPALLLNYFGQGALLLRDPTATQNPFYLLAPSWGLYPLVALATAATVIASQAVISGAFSVTRQAMQLGYCPRLTVVHTSAREIGQIYIPLVNWGLLAGVVVLVLIFRSSSNLAAAYGIAVTGTMAIDTILAAVVAATLWSWSRFAAIACAVAFLVVDLAFFGANVVKLFHGGWVPVVIAVAVFTLFSTWKRGRELLLRRLGLGAIDLDSFLAGIAAHPLHRVPGTAVFMTANIEGVPHALLHNLIHNKVLHERVVLLTVTNEDVPSIPAEERIALEPLAENFYRMLLRYGFKDEPDVPAALQACDAMGFEFNLMETSFFFSRETLISTKVPGMAQWREKLFISMARNAAGAMTFFRIPTNRVVELGSQVEL
ncbi:MAG: potassium transporter Kup [Gammaproteobacteria bacterium]|nr:potassium transporter Kup [Gammaproteobacteria bacterium]MBK9427801.1 potassium transporter Kup [Gammaproteobacteria bacterium]